MNRHLIQKQVVELTIDAVADFHPLANAFNDMIKQEVLPALSVHFDVLADDRTVIAADRLEIDLGVVDWNIPQGMLGKRIAELIVKKVTALITEKQGDMILSEVTPAAPASVHRWLAWQQYLETGVMPWFAETFMSRQEWETMLLGNAGPWYHPEVLDIINKVISNEEARKRLILVFSLSFIEAIAKATGRIDVSSPSIPALSRRLEKAMNVMPGIFQAISRDIFLTAADSPDPRIPVIDFFDRVIRSHSSMNWIPVLSGLDKLPDIRTIFPSASVLEEVMQFIRVLLTHQQETLFRHALEENPVMRILHPHFSSVAFEVIRGQHPDNVSGQPVARTKVKEQDAEGLREIMSGSRKNELQLIHKIKPEATRETSYVPYAGLVLAAPFLPALFERTGWVEQGMFLTVEAQVKAVRLVAFLASGQPDTPDWELAVPKIICGLTPADTIASEEVPDETLLQEATELLEAMIRHWNALGRTSPDGLRQGFLERQGKLSMRQNNWFLQVESRGIDMLLDRLPWGFGMIKLPWMQKLLITEWQVNQL